MHLNRLACSAFLVLSVAHAAAAQTARPTIDVERLPVDLQRISRELRQSSVREEREGLNLRYLVDVYGRAPRIVLWDPSDRRALTGPAPYGAPTHSEILYMITPQEHRSPVMNMGSLIQWLSNQAKKDKK